MPAFYRNPKYSSSKRLKGSVENTVPSGYAAPGDILRRRISPMKVALKNRVKGKY